MLALGASFASPSALYTQCSYASLQSANIHTQSPPRTRNHAASRSWSPISRNANRRVSPTETMTESRAHNLPRSGSVWYAHATPPEGYRLSSAQSNRWPVRLQIQSLSLATAGVNGVGFMTFPEYAKPPTPGSAIQHVSRRSSTRRPSRVTNCSARNGTSSTKVWTESETGGVDDAKEARREALDESSDAADSKRSDASVQPDDDASLERRCVLPAATEHSFAPRVALASSSSRRSATSESPSWVPSASPGRTANGNPTTAARLASATRDAFASAEDARRSRRAAHAAGTATREGMGPGPAWSIARARMAPHAASRCDGRGAREPNARIASAASASSMVLASVPPVSAS